jgi:hypothetical protein
MRVELCVGNYATYDCLVNGTNGVFKTPTSYHNKTIVWILFLNPKIGMLIGEQSTHLYTNNIQPNWTPIEPIIKDIRIGKSPSHIITRIQFLIQLAIAKTIHQSQGLSLNILAFDPTNVRKHGLSYIALSCIRIKEGLYLLPPLQHQNFRIDQCLIEKMNRLKTFANWTTFVPQLKNFYHSHVIIQALNTNSLKQHYQYINHDPNLQVSHVLCILETRIQSSNDVNNFINTSKYSYISIYDGHGFHS